MLTGKQSRFVSEYLVDLNATQAAVRAGYSVKRADAIGYENLRKPEIQTAIEKAMAKREQRTEITQDRVLKELARIGFADIRKVVDWGESVSVMNELTGVESIVHGITMRPAADLDDDTAAAISEIAETNQGLKVKFHDKQAALVNIGKHLGMFIDRKVISGDLTITKSTADMTDEELEQEAAKYGLKP